MADYFGDSLENEDNNDDYFETGKKREFSDGSSTSNPKDNEYLTGNEYNVSDVINNQVSKVYANGKKPKKDIPKDKFVETAYIDLIFSELSKINEIDDSINIIEDTLNNTDVLNRMENKELMRWYELMNVRKNHNRKFLMAFYESASKNDLLGKLLTQMTGKTFDPKELEQDNKTKTAKTILQKIMMDRLADEK